MPRPSKISDAQFLAVLRENAGLFAMTARAIKSQFNVNFTRQAVRARAAKFPDALKDIEEEMIDEAEEGLRSLAKSKNEQVKLKACEIILKTKGKHRGYVEKTILEHENPPVLPVMTIGLKVHQAQPEKKGKK